MEMTKLSCEKFLAELASKAPTPGGGGTAALVGAAGVALGNMVGNLTTGKKKYAAVEADIQALNTKADALRKELLNHVQKINIEKTGLLEQFPDYFASAAQKISPLITNILL